MKPTDAYIHRLIRLIQQPQPSEFKRGLEMDEDAYEYTVEMCKGSAWSDYNRLMPQTIRGIINEYIRGVNNKPSKAIRQEVGE